MNDLVDRGRTAYQKSSAIQSRSGIFLILLGLPFLLLGGRALMQGEFAQWTFFIVIMGVLFIGMGISSLIGAKKLREK